MDENHSACVPHQFRGYGLRHTWLFSHAWLYHYICRQSSWNRNFSSVCTAIISVPDMQISYSCCFPWAIPSDVQFTSALNYCTAELLSWRRRPQNSFSRKPSSGLIKFCGKVSIHHIFKPFSVVLFFTIQFYFICLPFFVNHRAILQEKNQQTSLSSEITQHFYRFTPKKFMYQNC